MNMNVSYMREELVNIMHNYKLVRDCYMGEQAIKNMGTGYLPKLTNMDDQQYNLYKSKAVFTPVLNRSIDGFIGLLTKKTASFNANDKFKEFIVKRGMNMKGSSLYDLEKNVFEEILTFGRVGLFTDYIVIDNVSSKADLTKTRNRPISSVYSSQNVINWNYNEFGILDLVVLKEYVKVNTDDAFVKKSVEQYRVLHFDDNGFYKQSIYRKSIEKKGEFILIEEVDVFVNNKRIDYIPFEIINYDGSDPDTVPNPPLLDMCTLNIHHYCQSADMEGARHMIAMPTPFYKRNMQNQQVDQVNYDENGNPIDNKKEMILGYSQMNEIGHDESVFFLELTAGGLIHIKEGMQEKMDMMAKIGARFLQTDKNVGESFETEYLRRSGEYSMLASIAITVSESIKRSLKMMQLWLMNSDEEIEFNIKANFASNKISDAQLTVLMQLYINQALPYEDLYKAVQDAELVDRLKDAEQALNKIREDQMV